MLDDGTGPGELDLRELLRVLTALRNGDFSPRLAGGESGLGGEIARTLNEILEMEAGICAELGRVAGEIGQGELGGEAELPELAGEWRQLARRFNLMAG